MKRVREGAEEKRWVGRGLNINGSHKEEEEMLRSIWVAEERRLAERRRREALLFGEDEGAQEVDERSIGELIEFIV